jgi:hypothetical protein
MASQYPPGDWRIFCASEQALFQGYADELASIGMASDGAKGPGGQLLPAVQYFQRDRSVGVDPLYQEPSSDMVWRGPYRFPATVEWADDLGNFDQEVDEVGVESVRRAKMVITVDNWKIYVIEAHDPAFTSPQPGDVVALYSSPAKHYTVNKVSRSGYTGTSAHYVEWELELITRASFTPDRLLPAKMREPLS